MHEAVYPLATLSRPVEASIALPGTFFFHIFPPRVFLPLRPIEMKKISTYETLAEIVAFLSAAAKQIHDHTRFLNADPTTWLHSEQKRPRQITRDEHTSWEEPNAKLPSYKQHYLPQDTKPSDLFLILISAVFCVVLVSRACRWCGPCKMMAGILSEVGPKMKDEIKIFKVGEGTGAPWGRGGGERSASASLLIPSLIYWQGNFICQSLNTFFLSVRFLGWKNPAAVH